MKFAYLILAHNDLEMLIQLIIALDYHENNLFIHIDKKSKIEIADIEKIEMKNAHIYVYKEINVRWGTSSQVDCELFLMKCASEIDFHNYYHVISGADYPIKSHEEIKQFFTQHEGKEFIHFDQPEINLSDKERIQYYHLFALFYKVTPFAVIHRAAFLLDDLFVALQKIIGIKRRSPYTSIQKGSNWCSITHDFVVYLLQNIVSIKKLVFCSKCADEIFIQTVIINSAFYERLFSHDFNNDYNSCARLIIWDDKNYKSPKTFSIDDLSKIQTSNAMFARKFSSMKSKELIECLKRNYISEVSDE